MITHDYSGEGPWSADEIIQRYHEYARRFGISPQASVEPKVSVSEGTRRVWPVMARIIDGIQEGDLACAQIGVEFIEEDQGFSFGAILKSNTARALRQCPGLSGEPVARIRARVVGMLQTGIVPREYREYMRLLRKIGIGHWWPKIVSATPRNHNAKRALAYFKNHCAPSESGDAEFDCSALPDIMYRPKHEQGE